MKVKLDENLGRRTIEVFAAAGHDVATVADQGLTGAADPDLLAVCVAEGRALVTLDLDFANPIRFDPAPTAGIAVLRVPDLPGRSDLVRSAGVLCDVLTRADMRGRLWVVDATRVRQYEPGADAWARPFDLPTGRCTLLSGGFLRGRRKALSVDSTMITDPHDHVVQFYEHDEQVVGAVGAYLAEGLRSGEAALVVATGAHRDAFEAWLTADGIDVADARERGTLVTLDAAGTLARFLLDGQPDAATFDAVIGGLVRDLRGHGRPLRIYGEMVAVLWDEGHVPAAIAVEALWNDLGRDVDFSLFCAYKSQQGDDLAAFDHVCGLHSAVTGDASRRFDHDAQSARAARRFVTETLERWRRHDDVLDDAAMVVTELVTNALVHARSATTVAVSSRPGTVRIEVADASPVPPVPRERHGTAASGRGIALVAAMAERWGAEPTPDGKVVWAELREGAVR